MTLRNRGRRGGRGRGSRREAQRRSFILLLTLAREAYTSTSEALPDDRNSITNLTAGAPNSDGMRSRRPGGLRHRDLRVGNIMDLPQTRTRTPNHVTHRSVRNGQGHEDLLKGGLWGR